MTKNINTIVHEGTEGSISSKVTKRTKALATARVTPTRRTQTSAPGTRDSQQATTTRGYYVQIPTGRPVRTTTVRHGVVGADILPTLPPGSRKMLLFDGNSWITYDLSLFPEEYLRSNGFEQFHLRFKTEEPNGLLWYSGNENRNIHLSLKVRLFN